MGHGVRLAFHEPIQKVTIRKSGSLKRPTSDCAAQMLRLWQYPTKQTMMFYANISCTNREYNSKYTSPLRDAFKTDTSVQHLRPVQTKSRTELRLEVCLPDQPRRKSRTKSSGSLDTATTNEEAMSAHEPANSDLHSISYITMTFSYAEGAYLDSIIAEVRGARLIHGSR